MSYDDRRLIWSILKIPTLLAVVLMICAVVVPVCKGQNSDTRPNSNQHKGAQKVSPQGQISPADQKISVQCQCTPTDQRSYWDKATGPETIPTWILAVFGIFATIAAYRTLKQVERQAKANEDTLAEIKRAAETTTKSIEIAQSHATAAAATAEAAAASAQAVIQSERAWVLVNEVTPLTFQLERKYGVCKVVVQNYGKTPAALIHFRANYSALVRSRDEAEELKSTLDMNSIYEDWKTEEHEVADILPPGKAHTFEVYNKVPPEIFNDDEASLWLHGLIVYQDIFSLGSDSFHETYLFFSNQQEGRWGWERCEWFSPDNRAT